MGITSFVWEILLKRKFLRNFITVHESRFQQEPGEGTSARNGEKFCMLEQSRKKTVTLCTHSEYLLV